MVGKKVNVPHKQASYDPKHISLGSLCNVLAVLHLILAAGLVLLATVLVPLVTELKRQSYQELDNESSILKGLGVTGVPTTPMLEAAQVLALILPHGANNLEGSTVGLDKLLFNGVLINVAISALFLFCGTILRSKSAFAVRLSLSLLLTLDLSLLMLVLSSLVFGANANIKLPFWPLSVWSDLILQQLAIHRIYPVTPAKYANLDIATIANLHDVSRIDRFCSLAGLRLLNKMFEPSMSFTDFLLQCCQEVWKNTRYGSVPMFVTLAAAVFLDLLPLLYVARQTIAVLPNVLRSVKPYKRVLAGPLVYLVCCLALAKVFLCNYPSCTMKDRIPDDVSLDVVDKPRYLLFTKSFLTRPGQPRTAVDVFLPPTRLLKALRGIATRDPNGKISPLPRAQCTDQRNDTHSWPWNSAQTPEDEMDDLGKGPSFISATRYNRRMGLRWPFTAMKVWGQESGAGSVAIWTWPLTRGLVEQQFPVVILDARGTGASQGIRLIDLDEPEIEDFDLVAQWTRTRFWSDGILAGGGVSYDGLTALKLAAKGKSPLDIAVAMYSPLHPVTDLLQNNGMACRSFVDDYAGLTKAFEQRGSPLWHWLSSDASYIPFQIKLGVSEMMSIFLRSVSSVSFYLSAAFASTGVGRGIRQNIAPRPSR